MKPEKGLSDMDEKPYDPRELFSEIGLLVSEGRTPVRSLKGREEGPHCPLVKGTREHECDRHKEQCRKARDFLKLQSVLWENKIPMRVDVLLFPSCEHGYREETIVEGATMSSVDNFELLERWDVQLVKKRSPERLEGFVNGRSHLQAVRSYLHFSQLSSWLISTGGALPHRVVYRAYAPGESVGYSFSRLPEVHNFPSADLGDFVMRTTVAHLPRQESLLTLVCRSPSPCIEPYLRSTRKMAADERPSTSSGYLDVAGRGLLKNEPRPSTSRYEACSHSLTDLQTHSKDKMEYGKSPEQQMSRKPPIGRKWRLEGAPQSRSQRSPPCPVSTTPKRKVDQLSPKMQFHQHQQCDSASPLLDGTTSSEESSSSYVYTVTSSSGPPVIPTQYPSIVKSQSSTQDQFKYPGPVPAGKLLFHKKPATLSVTTNSIVSSKRLPSPKVLVTGSKRPEPTTYKKRCLDLSTPETVQENIEDFVGFKNVEDFTANDICDLVKPLSPGDLEAYLSSLSNKASKRFGASKLDDIPTTKCSFYLGEDLVANQSKLTGSLGACCSYDCDDEYSTSPLDSVFVNQYEPAKCLSNSPNSTDDKPQHVRALFQKSLSTSDVDDSVHVCSPLNTRSNACTNARTNVGMHEPPFKMEKAEASCDISTSCDRRTVQVKPVMSETCASSMKESRQRETTPSSSQKRETTPTASQRKRNVFDQSIPCSVGGVNVAMKNLMQNLESMDIDDRPCSSPSLDREVEKHLNSRLASNGAEGSSRDNNGNSSGHDEADRSSPSQKGLSLCKQILRKEFQLNVKNEILSCKGASKKSLPSPEDIQNFQFVMGRSVSAIFNTHTGLPSRSSPAPIKKKSSTKFDYDCSLTNVRAIKNALSCSKLTLQSEDNVDTVEDPKIISTSAPASTNCLLGNFEESVLNGRIEPVGVVDGFSVEIGASGLFCPKHVTLPVAAYFFQLSDDNAPSPYLGHVNLEPLGKRGYHIPRIGTVQVTLFNPNRTVVKMFVVMYDLSDMPANCQTFLRQRTLYMPAEENSSEPSYLRYLIHIRFQSSKSGKVYLHTDIRLIFARDKFEFDPRVANYELRSFTESPVNPKFSPKR